MSFQWALQQPSRGHVKAEAFSRPAAKEAAWAGLRRSPHLYNLTQTCKSRATSSSSGTQRSCDDVQCFLKIKTPCSFIEISYVAYGPFSVESMCFSTSWSCATIRTMVLKYCYRMDTGTLFLFLVTRHSPDYLCPGQLLAEFSPPRISTLTLLSCECSCPLTWPFVSGYLHVTCFQTSVVLQHPLLSF